MEQNLRDLFKLIIKLKERNVLVWSMNLRKFNNSKTDYINHEGVEIGYQDGNVSISYRDNNGKRQELVEFEVSSADEMINRFREACDESLYRDSRIELDNDEFRSLILKSQDARVNFSLMTRYKTIDDRNKAVKIAEDTLRVIKEFLQE